jgi:hypothetical protein
MSTFLVNFEFFEKNKDEKDQNTWKLFANQ